MLNPAVGLSFALVLLTPLSAYADLKKCVSSSGTVTYTDQPCASKAGESVKEVRDDAALKKISSRIKEQDVGKSCWQLSHRYSQCSVAVEQLLMQNFRENCTIPINQFERDRSRENSRSRNYREEQEGNDLEYNHRYTRKSRDVLECDGLQRNMWDFLKSTFGDKISQQDAKAIDYKLQVAPADGRDPVILKRNKSEARRD